MRTQSCPPVHHQRLQAAALLWLGAGGFLLLTTMVPAHTALLGWTPAFWLLAAPLVVLLGLEPRRPGEWWRQRRVRRLQAIHAVHGAVWH